MKHQLSDIDWNWAWRQVWTPVPSTLGESSIPIYSVDRSWLENVILTSRVIEYDKENDKRIIPHPAYRNWWMHNNDFIWVEHKNCWECCTDGDGKIGPVQMIIYNK